jgi:4-carboxymuconolactone decarboxylase
MGARDAGSDRLPEIATERMTDAQREAAAEFERLRGHAPFGPFMPLLRSPKLMLAANAMGQYLRYKSALPLRINEFVILITAREWTQQLEWQIHQPIALEAGLDPKIAQAIAEGRRPDDMPEEEAAAWAFATELHRNKSVSDATYAKALALFGEHGVMDLVGLCGYYSLLAMAMNVARTPAPSGSAEKLKAFPA